MSSRFLDRSISGRTNCNPHRFQPSMGMIRTTRALSIRTVYRKFTFPRAGATGISSDTRDRRRKGLRIASSAPPALSSSKVQNSTNSRPCPSTPRTNTGMARRSRTQRRRSAAGRSAAVGPRPRRIGNHSRTEDGLPGRVTTDDIVRWILRDPKDRTSDFVWPSEFGAEVKESVFCDGISCILLRVADASVLLEVLLGNSVEGERGNSALQERSCHTPCAAGAAPAAEIVAVDPDQMFVHTSPAFCMRLGLKLGGDGRNTSRE
jgi:hypothetical protein